MPQRFGLVYTDSDNTEKTPVMIHRAILGSFERFIGILIEHYAANFPLWLAPEQARILTISEKTNDYAKTVFEKLSTGGICDAASIYPMKKSMLKSQRPTAKKFRLCLS